MAEQWVEAGRALDTFRNPVAICERAHAGLIRARADRFKKDDQELQDAELPREFWWAEGHEALEQNWEAADFSTWIEGREHWRAFGVRFALDDLLQLVPFEERAAVRRRFSVAGNPAWVSSREARRFAYDVAKLQPVTAGLSIIEQCRFGFILARAIEMKFASNSKPNDWACETREWDIPLWFWDEFTRQDASTQNWETGRFAGRGRSPQGSGWMTLEGVHFLRTSLDALLPTSENIEGIQAQYEPAKPPLPEAELQRWWDKRAAVREALSQADLWALAKADFPNHAIARDRIRALSEGRTPGPKRN